LLACLLACLLYFSDVMHYTADVLMRTLIIFLFCIPIICHRWINQ